MERKLHLLGWGLFLVCAALFIGAGVRDRDALTLSGSVVFFVASVIFIIPLLKRD